MSTVAKSADAAGQAASEQPTQGSSPGAGATPGAVPFAQRGAIYTMTAREGVSAAELVNAAFQRRSVGAVTPRRVEVVAPDGPSTSGGKRARQTIRLVPVAGESAPVMCGYLDVAKKRVELRGYTAVAQQFRERFDKPFDVSASEYATLCKDLENTLVVFRYEFTQESEAPAPFERPAQVGQPKARVLNVVLACLLSAVIVALLVAIASR